MATSSLGPVLAATLVTPDVQQTLTAYCGHLGLKILSQDHVTLKQARQWNLPGLAGAPEIWLANELGERWLRVIGAEDAQVVDPFRHSGWMSLEISVKDVDALRPALDDSPFQVIGEPANLDVSDDIRAMQAIGPCGEVLHLTEVKAPVPPFELPFARCAVDRLFIPVMLAGNRDESLAVFERFPGTEGLKFDTKITVINRARELDIEQKHPVATIQLKGETLVEIDQLNELDSRPLTRAGLPAGIAMVTFATESIPEELLDRLKSKANPANAGSTLIEGGAGELIELIQTDNETMEIRP